MTFEPADDDERFRERYSASGAAALLAVEAEAVGSDYQANGFTTITQADELGRALRLRPGQVLLDVGAGCGWPGLYLASRHGCAVISADPIAEGVRVARQRAVADGLTGRSSALCAAAEALPLRRSSVDAVVHTDLLC
jgi:2-polyprenyl-3-methyl-5-hydroxy-6-metoxy-1,4-benzoquinol methylase